MGIFKKKKDNRTSTVEHKDVNQDPSKLPQDFKEPDEDYYYDGDEDEARASAEEIHEDAVQIFSGKRIVVITVEDGGDNHYYKELDDLLERGYHIVSIFTNSNGATRVILKIQDGFGHEL